MKIESLGEALALSDALSQYIENAADPEDQNDIEKNNLKFARQMLDHADDIIANFKSDWYAERRD